MTMHTNPSIGAEPSPDSPVHPFWDVPGATPRRRPTMEQAIARFAVRTGRPLMELHTPWGRR